MSETYQKSTKSPLSLPPKVYVGYRDYTISPMEEEEKADYVGLHHAQAQTIHLNTDAKPNEVVNTLLHEIFHAVFDVAAFSFKTDEDEEGVVMCLGNGFTQVLRDNPDVTIWMLNQLDAKQLQT